MKKLIFFTLLFLFLIPCVSMAQGAEVNYSYVDDGALKMGVTLDSPQDNSGLYIAVYTKEGILSDMRKCSVDSSICNVDVTVSDFERKNGEIVKLLYLGENLKPLAESVCYGTKGRYLTGIITATPVIGGETLATDEVEISLTQSHGYDEWEERISDDSTWVFEHCVPDINSYYGRNVKIYIEKVSDGKWMIYDVSENGDSSFTIEKCDIDSIESGSLKYYESDTAMKTTNVKLNEDTFVVVVNNVRRDIDYIMSRYLSDEAEITMVENTGDSKYDLMIVKDYAYDIIDEVEANKNRFSTKFSTGKFTFDFEDVDVIYSITNSEGDAISLSDFNKGDVIAYILDGNRKTASEYSWIEIINLGQNYVNGTVTEVDANTGSVYIDGIEYETSDYIESPRVGEEGLFYLTKANKIFGMSADTSVASNYAYILDIGESDSTFSRSWQVKMLTRDGSIAIYDMADVFTVVDKYGDARSVKAEAASWDDLGFLEGLEVSHDFKSNVDLRFITYKSDSNGKIRQINAVSSFIAVPSGSEYNGNAMAISNRLISENAVIFNLVSEDKDRAYVTGVSSLVHDGEYEGYLVRNEELEYDAFIVTAGKGAIDLSQDIAVVERVNRVTINDDEVWKVKYYASGDETLKEIILTYDTTVEYSDSSIEEVVAYLAKGDVIMLADNGSGVATSIAHVAEVDEDEYKVNVMSDDEDVYFVTGYIGDIRKTSNGTNIMTGSGNILTVRDTVNAYTYIYRNVRNISVVVGDWMGGDVDIADYETGEANSFFAVVENGIVSDIITHSCRGEFSLYSDNEFELLVDDNRINFTTSGAYLMGVVSETPVIGTSCASDEVAIYIRDCYGNTGLEEQIGNEYIFKHNLSDINDYYGMIVSFCVESSGLGQYEITKLFAESGNVVLLEKGSIDEITTDNIKYYESATATKTTNINLSGNCVAIINNVRSNIDGIKRVSDDAELVIIENSGDSKYDLIVIKDYNYDVVDGITLGEDGFTLKNTTGEFTFDFSDTDACVSMTNKYGEPINLTDFNENDVVAYILDGGNKTTGTYNWIEIINFGQNSVRGKVVEIDESANLVYIDGVEYRISSDLHIPNLNESGTFYLTKSGKIFGMEFDEAVSPNYAYILNIGEAETTFSNGWQVQLLNKNGDVEIYDMADTFSIVDRNGESVSVKASSATLSDLGFLQNLMYEDFKSDVDARVITYKLDSNNKIRQINAARNLIYVEGVYDKNTGSIGSKPLSENALIFNLISSDMDSYFTMPVSSLLHEGEYEGFLVVNNDLEYVVFVITAGRGSIDVTQNLAIVDSVTVTTLNDDDAWKVKYYTSGNTELEEIILVPDTIVEYSYEAVYDFVCNLTRGSAFMFSSFKDNIASSVMLVAKANSSTDSDSEAYVLNQIGDAFSEKDNLTFISGYIVNYKELSDGVAVTYSGDKNGEAVVEDIFVLNDTTNAYTYYNATSSRISVVPGDWKASDSIDIASDGMATFFIAIVKDGVASDIVTYSTRKSIG